MRTFSDKLKYALVYRKISAKDDGHQLSMTSKFHTDPNYSLDRTISVAPMMGCTDRHCRHLLRLISPNSLLYSEMIVTGAMIHGDAPHFLEHRSDEPVSLQLGGSNPAELATCAKLVENSGYQEINLNVGCPSDRVQYGGIGACLMANPELIADCFTAMQEKVQIPVTVKCRIGIDDQDSFEHFYSFVKPVYDAGCRTFIVHARKAILQGLSPKDNREIPPLKYDYVYRIQEAFPEAVFILNGGLKTVDQTLEQLQKVQGVMLGRATYSNPWILAELEEEVFTTPRPDRSGVALAFRAYMVEEMENGVHFKHMAKHLLGLFTGIPGARAFRRYLSTHMHADDTPIELLDEALAHIQHSHPIANSA